MENKRIVFIENYSTVMLYKISRLFQKEGCETILIRLREPPEMDREFYKNAYDKMIDFNLFNKKYLLLDIILLIRVMFLNPDIIIGRAPPNITIAFFRIIFHNKPFIYFPYDIHAHWVPTKELAKKVRKLSSLEIFSEKFCFEKCDGIMHKGAPNELNPEYLNRGILGENTEIQKLKITFHPYCSREFMIRFNKNKISKKDGEIHTVCIASAGKNTKENYVERFNEYKCLIEQKIHVHVYINSNINDRENSAEKDFLEEYKNYPDIEYFHIHKALDPKKIIKEISRYDFGLSPPLVEFSKFDLDRKFSLANRYSTFLEAGLPFFYRGDLLLFTEKIMKKYKLNLNYPKNMNMKKMIARLDYEELEKRILEARKDFLIEKHFPRLRNFVNKIIETKK